MSKHGVIEKIYIDPLKKFEIGYYKRPMDVILWDLCLGWFHIYKAYLFD